VYAFFISAAIIEETLFRGGLVMLIQAILYKFTKAMMIANWGSIVISAILFSASHVAYWNDPFLLALTFFGGCSQGYFYLKTRTLLVPIFAHTAINFAASGSVVQTL